MSAPHMTGLDLAMQAWQDARADREAREQRSRAAFKGHRRRILADPSAHALQRTRMSWHGRGMSVADLARRSTVAESTIHKIESGEAERDGKRVSDATWTRLLLGLGSDEHGRPYRREQIDEKWIR